MNMIRLNRQSGGVVLVNAQQIAYAGAIGDDDEGCRLYFVAASGEVSNSVYSSGAPMSPRLAYLDVEESLDQVEERIRLTQMKDAFG